MKSRVAVAARAAAPLVAVACAIGVLLRFPPGQYGFYPECPVYALLHIECPGCGTTRALAALLHGDVVEALRLNELTTVMLPFVAVYAGICYWRFLLHEKVKLPRVPDGVVYAGIVVAVGFMVLRNFA